MKFEEFLSLVEQPQEYVLNDNGRLLIQEYLKFIDEIKKWVEPDAVVSLISNIEATNRAKPVYIVAKRLATLTNDGQKNIDATNYSISDNDVMMQYLTKRPNYE